MQVAWLVLQLGGVASSGGVADAGGLVCVEVRALLPQDGELPMRVARMVLKLGRRCLSWGGLLIKMVMLVRMKPCWGRRLGCSRSWRRVALGIGVLLSELASCSWSWGVAVRVGELPFSPAGCLRQDRSETGRSGRPFTYKNGRFITEILRQDRSGRIALILHRPGHPSRDLVPTPRAAHQLREQLPNSDSNS